MHELSLAQGLLRQVSALAEEHGARRVLRVRVAIGPLSGVVVDSFAFGFEALSGDSPVTRDASLELETPLPTYVCMKCGTNHEACAARPEACRQCQGDCLMPRGGDDILLVQVEME